MNVMITNLSLINGNKKNKEGEQLKSYKYEYKDEGEKEYTIEAIQTNEAATKFYIEWLRNRNEHLDKIVYLASEEVRVNKRIIEKGDKTFWTINEETENGITTEEYYKNIIQDFAGNDKLEFIAVDYGSDGITSSLDEIAKNLEEGDVVYLDTTGGKRDYGNSLQLLVKFLNYKGVTVKMPLYCDMNFQSGVGAIKIVDTYDLLEVLDGVNQFVTTGRSTILEKVFEVENVKQVKELLGEMNKFSDDILICKVDKLDEYYNKIKTIVNSLKDDNCLNVNNKLVIFKQMLDIIKSKFIGTDIVDSENDILNVLQWCVDNDLIQQALTIYVERVPKYLIYNEIIIYDKSLDSVKAAEWFYKELLDLQDKDADIIKQFKDEYREIQNNYAGVEKEILRPHIPSNDVLKKYFERFKDFFYVGNNLCCEFNGGSYDYEEFKKDMLLNKYSNNTYMHNYIQKINANSLLSVMNYIINNEPILRAILGLNGKVKDIVLRKSLTADNIKYWIENGKIKINEACCCDKRIKEDNVIKCRDDSVCKIKEVFYDYIFAKAMRNCINHASVNENFNDDNKEKYINLGYVSVQNRTPGNIKRDLERALSRLRELKENKNK